MPRALSGWSGKQPGEYALAPGTRQIQPAEDLLHLLSFQQLTIQAQSDHFLKCSKVIQTVKTIFDVLFCQLSFAPADLSIHNVIEGLHR